jgi:2-methylcitrate dehydratase PrpD
MIMSVSLDDTHTDSPPLTIQLARSIADRQNFVSPATVQDKVRLCLLDFFSCALEAHDLPWSRQAAAIANGEDGPCTIIASARAVWPGDAAFANGVAGHGLVREDMHAGAVAHLGVVVLPALLALAEARGLSMSRFIEAAVIGYEVGAKLGRAIVTPEFTRSFRPTGFVGPLAVAAAGSALLGLDERRCANALALAANMACGLNQWPHTGADDMFFHPGLAARNGLTAVDLAERGAYGSEKALDGEAGLLTAYRPDRHAPDVVLFDGEPEILSAYFKPVPVCNFAQTPALAAIRLATEEPIDPRQITAVRVRVSRAAKAYPGCDYAGPFERILQAKMSIHYAVASALLGKTIEEDSYRHLDDAGRLALSAKITIEADAEFTAAFPQRQGATVEIALADGRMLSRSLPNVLAAEPELVRQRFGSAASAVIGTTRAELLQAAVLRGDGDIASLMHLTKSA